MKQILVLNGPNLNLLGQREPEIYGHATIQDIEEKCMTLAKELGLELEFFQHNHEGVLIDLIQEAGKCHVDMIIINPAAYTHTSVAIRDAIVGVNIPCIELHLSNVHQRESFRHHSYFSDIAVGTIIGFGALGYELAILAAHDYLSKN